MADWNQIREKDFSLSTEFVYMNNSTFGSPLNIVNEKQSELVKRFSEGMYGERLLREVIFKLRGVTGSIAETICPGDEKPLIGIVNSVTEGMSLVANGIQLTAKDTILITDHEHNGGEMPWLLQAKRHGTVIKKLPLMPSADGDTWKEDLLERIKSIFETSTIKVISVPYITTSTGHILPIQELCSLARQFGVISVIDAAQAFSVLEIDFNSLGCDILVANGHKYLCGPIGTGFIAVSPKLAEPLMPTVVDKHNMEKGYKKGGPMSYPSVFALSDAINHYNVVGSKNIYTRLQKIGEILREELSSASDIFEVITPEDSDYSCVMTCFRVKGKSSEEIDTYLSRNGVHIKHANEGGADALRISAHYYNTQQEFNQLSKAIGMVTALPESEWPQFDLEKCV